MTNEIEDLKISLKDRLVGGYTGPETPGWVNVNWYKESPEVPVGVLPVPQETKHEYGLDSYVPPPARSKAPRYDILAELQGTRKPILPVHTPAEHGLYRSFMRKHSDHSTRAPNWSRMAKDWNSIAQSNDNIYYKVRV